VGIEFSPPIDDREIARREEGVARKIDKTSVLSV